MINDADGREKYFNLLENSNSPLEKAADDIVTTELADQLKNPVNKNP